MVNDPFDVIFLWIERLNGLDLFFSDKVLCVRVGRRFDPEVVLFGMNVADKVRVTPLPTLKSAFVVLVGYVGFDPSQELLKQSPARHFKSTGRTLESLEKLRANQRDHCLPAFSKSAYS